VHPFVELGVADAAEGGRLPVQLADRAHGAGQERAAAGRVRHRVGAGSAGHQGFEIAVDVADLGGAEHERDERFPVLQSRVGVQGGQCRRLLTQLELSVRGVGGLEQGLTLASGSDRGHHRL